MGVQYNTSIVTNGLQLCLDAANTKSYPGSGTSWVDLSGNGNNGTIIGSPTFDSANNGSFLFNGTSQYISMGDKFNTSSGTIACWVTVNNNITTSNTLNYRICGKTTNFEFRWIASGVDGGAPNFGALTADLGAGTSIDVQTSQRTWTANQWYYVALTWNQSGNASNIYVNGVLGGTGLCGNITGQVTDSFDIGRSGTRGYLAGKISLFKVYNTVLTASQISQNFNATRGRYGI